MLIRSPKNITMKLLLTEKPWSAMSVHMRGNYVPRFPKKMIYKDEQ